MWKDVDYFNQYGGPRKAQSITFCTTHWCYEIRIFQHMMWRDHHKAVDANGQPLDVTTTSVSKLQPFITIYEFVESNILTIECLLDQTYKFCTFRFILSFACCKSSSQTYSPIVLAREVDRDLWSGGLSPCANDANPIMLSPNYTCAVCESTLLLYGL